MHRPSRSIAIDKESYDRFKQGDTLLIEHLRRPRLPFAIYRGHAA